MEGEGVRAAWRDPRTPRLFRQPTRWATVAAAGRYDQDGQHFVLQRIDLHVLHALLLEGVDLEFGREADVLGAGRETLTQALDDMRVWRRGFCGHGMENGRAQELATHKSIRVLRFMIRP